MAIKSFTTTQFGDRKLEQIQSAVKTSLDSITSAPIVNGVLLTNVTLPSSPTTINHTLGRKPVGCIVVSTQAAASFADNIVTGGATTTTFVISASTGTTANLWVF